MNSPVSLAPLNDRRQQERRILRVQAELALPGRAPLAVRTMDVSVGGISVQCPLNLPVHTRCTVRFSLPAPPSGRRPMAVQAVVRYSILSSNGGGFELGMSTDALRDDEAAAISSYIKN